MTFLNYSISEHDLNMGYGFQMRKFCLPVNTSCSPPGDHINEIPRLGVYQAYTKNT